MNVVSISHKTLLMGLWVFPYYLPCRAAMTSHPCSDLESSPLLTYSHLGLALQIEDKWSFSEQTTACQFWRQSYLPRSHRSSVIGHESRSIYRQIPVISCIWRADKWLNKTLISDYTSIIKWNNHDMEILVKNTNWISDMLITMYIIDRIYKRIQR